MRSKWEACDDQIGRIRLDEQLLGQGLGAHDSSFRSVLPPPYAVVERPFRRDQAACSERFNSL